MILLDSGVIGGPGKGIFQFLKHAPSEKFDYVLCNFEYGRAQSREFIDAARAKGLNLRLIKERFRFDPSIVSQAYEIYRSERCTIIQTHGYKTHLIGYILSRLYKVPWIAWAHGRTRENWRVRLYHAFDKFTLAKADLAVAVSPALFEEVSARRQGKRTELLLNAIDSEELVREQGGAVLRENLGIPAEAILIGNFARLSPEKGQRILLQALRDVRQLHPSVRLIIVGHGPERVALEAYARELGLSECVHFLGYQKLTADHFEALDLFVLPSLFEGLANVMLEAMSMGVPVLASDVGAAREVIINGETGWIVPPGNVKTLAERMSAVLLQREELRAIGARGKESLYPKFSAASRAERIARLYENLT